MTLMTQLAIHPKAILEKDFLMKYRQPISERGGLVSLPEEILTEPETGVRYVTADGKRKRCIAKVTVWEKGTGQFDINGRGLEDFTEIYQR